MVFLKKIILLQEGASGLPFLLILQPSFESQNRPILCSRRPEQSLKMYP